MQLEPTSHPLALRPQAPPRGRPGVEGARWRQRDITGEDDAPAAPPRAAEPEVSPREEELWALARRAQGAAVRLDFELRTAAVRQMFRRDFVFVSRQLHALEASRRVQGLDRAALDDALGALLRRADDVRALLDRVATELQAAIDAHAPAGAAIAFPCPTRFQAWVVSPLARRHLALLLRCDDTLARLEMAWLLGLVDPARRSALASDCRRALQGFKELACAKRQAIGADVRALNAQRRRVVEDGDG